MIRPLPLFFLVLALSGAGLLRAESVSIELEAFRVTLTEAGEEVFETAETAAPGEVIEYRAQYANSAEGATIKIVPEIPVPEGLVFLPHAGDGFEAPSEALLANQEWVDFAAMGTANPDFEAAEVRALRWPSEDLPAGATRTIKFRTQVAR